jgi:hypothetical protein
MVMRFSNDPAFPSHKTPIKVLIVVYLLIAVGALAVALVYSGATNFFFPTPKVFGTTVPLNISVTRIVTDTVEFGQPVGYTYWILQVFINNTDKVNHYIDPFYFELTTNSDLVYTNTYVAAIHDPLPSVNLSSGQTAKGQIAFKLPNTTIPSKLVYSYVNASNEKLQITVSSLPRAYSTVSFLEGGPAKVVGNSSNYLSAYATLSFFPSDTYSYAGYFYSGNVTSVRISLNNYLQGTNITLISVSVSNPGFTILGLSHSFPVTVGRAELNITLYLEPPQTPLIGQLNITVATI